MLAACLPLKRRNISLLHKLLAAEIPLWWYFEMYLKCNEGNGSGHIPDKEEMEQKCSPQIELPVTISSSSHHPFFLIWWHSHDQHITSDMSRRATNSVIATKMASSPCFSLHLSLKEEQPAQSKSQSIRGNTRNTKNPKKCTNIREKHRFMKIQNAATNTKIQVLANEGTSKPAKSKSQFKQKGIWIQIFLFCLPWSRWWSNPSKSQSIISGGRSSPSQATHP